VVPVLGVAVNEHRAGARANHVLLSKYMPRAVVDWFMLDPAEDNDGSAPNSRGTETTAGFSEADPTELLIAHRNGDEQALDKLLPRVYEDLRRIARVQLARLRPGNTLDTTALVHEAYLKLFDESRIEPNDLDHFFALAARAMRQLLVDHVRQRTTLKRGGGAATLSIDGREVGIDRQADTLLAIDLALERLSRNNPRLTRVFECRFFAGLSEEETARAVGVSLRTVQRDWLKSRAWLRRELEGWDSE